MRKSSIRKRLERLEAVRQKGANVVFIEIWPDDCVGERHLVMTSSPDAGLCWFQERPGPGPKLEDFGEFECVLHLTTAEMNL
jgi:hypothetical protein